MKSKKKIRFRFFCCKDGKVLAIVEAKKRRGYKGFLTVTIGTTTGTGTSIVL